MRIGLDIASLACKKKVDQIILIAGDSDFVPAAKLARREGLDFILDPMEATISADLFEHTDGLKSCWKHDHSKIEKGHWIRRKNKKNKNRPRRYQHRERLKGRKLCGYICPFILPKIGGKCNVKKI